MAEYSKIARGSFTTAASPVIQVIPLPFQPTQISLTCPTSYNSSTQYGTTRAYWDVSMGQGVANQEYISAASFPFVLSADYVSSGGISTYSQGLALQLGPQQQVASTTKATSTITTSTAHGLVTGDVVILEGMYQSATTGVPQLSNIPWIITNTGTTTFTINTNFNQSNYTDLTPTKTGAYVRKVLNPYLYLPSVNYISAISLSGANVVVTTSTNHNYVVGQEIAFRIPAAFGSTQLNSLPNNSVPGSPIYYYVTALNSNTQFTCSALSAGVSAFTNNPTVASVPGLTWAQVVAVGDVNTGGTPYSGGNLYPSPSFPTYSGGMPTINGPAISGAFVNNTQQGFVIGLGVGAAAATNSDSAPLMPASALIFWEAKFYDIG
jgi:hypothetical protein